MFKLIEDCDQGLEVEVVELFNGSWRLVNHGTIIRIQPEDRFEFVTSLGPTENIYLLCKYKQEGETFFVNEKYVEPASLEH